MSQPRVPREGSPAVVPCRVCAAPVVWEEPLGAWVHEPSGRVMRGDLDGGAHRAMPG